jgi:two-component system nitrogen regulation response regulator NtrX
VNLDFKDNILDESIIGNSNIINNLRLQLKKLSSFLNRILIVGKPGTYKKRIAKLIHDSSKYANFPFYNFDCSTEDNLEYKLFGQENKDTILQGLIEKCSPGTLFFNNISNLPIYIQKQLVYVLQNQTIRRINGQNDINIKTRFLASSSKDINNELITGKLEKSLYNRIGITKIVVPSLSERVSDIPDICNFLMQNISYKLNINPPTLSDDTIAIMQSYDWPGNIAELKNILESILKTRHSAIIKIDDLPKHMISSVQTCLGFCPKIMQMSLKDARKEFEKGYITMQLKRFENNITKTAEFIGMERSALYRKIKELNID